ncbi:TolC family protein [Alienimonas chondri]|uniref:TolC family protein n=1 Tax=Alienimonas chondri TaxID=2681879 RepID=UPI0014889614|nr:TolC family protein [Alienimonas chondri]
MTAPGCAWVGGGSTAEPNLTYLGDARPAEHIETGAKISYAHGVENDVRPLLNGAAPRTVADMAHAEIWDLPLDAAVKIALENSEILRTVAPRGNATGTGFQTAALANPDGTPSLFDPAIAQTGVLFGNRGVEAALADFDANFTSSLLFSRDETLGNNAGFGNFGGTAAGVGAAALTPGETVTNSSAYQAQLGKTLATGGSVAAFGNINYLDTDPSFGVFPNSYDSNVGLRFNQPLLAGSGVEYTRIAGPRNPNFSAITGVNQGVIIARINEDINLLTFEQNVRDLVKSTEDAYWNLYNAYRQYDTRLTARNSALRTWRDLRDRREIEDLRSDELGESQFEDEDALRTIAFQTQQSDGNTTPAQLAQAENQYFQQKSLATQALNDIYAAEAELRRVMVLPVNDGRVIRPATEPITAEFVPDWHASLAEALCHRPELRQQKFRIKSLEYQLTAARSLTRPSLNFTSQVQVNGFGDDLIADEGDSSAFGTLADGDQTGWQLGLEYSAPIGFRQANLQVRNLEYRLTKARKVLAAQELDVSHQLADAFQQVALRHATATNFFNQIGAAQERVRILDAQRSEGALRTDFLLRAQTDLAAAEGAYFQEIVAYNQAQALLQLTKGTLLDANGVQLAEGMWTPKSYQQAMRRAWERSHALPAEHLQTSPAPFTVPEDERACPQFLTNGCPSGPAFLPQQAPTDFTPGPLPPPVHVPEPSPGEAAADRTNTLAAPEPAPAPVPVAPLPTPAPERERSPGDVKEQPADPLDLVPELDGVVPDELDVDAILKGLDLAPPDEAGSSESGPSGEPMSAAETLRSARRSRIMGDAQRSPRATGRVTPVAGTVPVMKPVSTPQPAATKWTAAPTTTERSAAASAPVEKKWHKPRKARPAASFPADEPAQFHTPKTVVPAVEEQPVSLGEWVSGD